MFGQVCSDRLDEAVLIPFIIADALSHFKLPSFICGCRCNTTDYKQTQIQLNRKHVN